MHSAWKPRPGQSKQDMEREFDQLADEIIGDRMAQLAEENRYEPDPNSAETDKDRKARHERDRLLFRLAGMEPTSIGTILDGILGASEVRIYELPNEKITVATIDGETTVIRTHKVPTVPSKEQQKQLRDERWNRAMAGKRRQ